MHAGVNVKACVEQGPDYIKTQGVSEQHEEEQQSKHSGLGIQNCHISQHGLIGLTKILYTQRIRKERQDSGNTAAHVLSSASHDEKGGPVVHKGI